MINGWFISTWTGGLLGHGRANDRDERAGEISEGSVLTVRIDFDEGTIDFAVDGVKHGGGFQGQKLAGEGLFWAVTMYYEGQAVEYLPGWLPARSASVCSQEETAGEEGKESDEQKDAEGGGLLFCDSFPGAP